jgi:hypothetical protein
MYLYASEYQRKANKKALLNGRGNKAIFYNILWMQCSSQFPNLLYCNKGISKKYLIAVVHVNVCFKQLNRNKLGNKRVY